MKNLSLLGKQVFVAGNIMIITLIQYPYYIEAVEDCELVDRTITSQVIEGVIYSLEESIPEFKKVKFATAHMMYNLRDLPTSYFVELSDECKIIGYLIISARKNYHPFFKASPTPLSITSLKKRLKHRLLEGRKWNKEVIREKLIYLGGLFPYLELETTTEEKHYFPFFPSCNEVTKLFLSKMQKNYEKNCEKEEDKKLSNAWQYYLEFQKKRRKKNDFFKVRYYP